MSRAPPRAIFNHPRRLPAPGSKRGEHPLSLPPPRRPPAAADAAASNASISTMNASASTGNMQYVALPANVPNNAILVLQNNQLIVQPPNSASPTPAPAEAPHRAIVPAAPVQPFLVEVPVAAGAIPGRVDEAEDGDMDWTAVVAEPLKPVVH